MSVRHCPECGTAKVTTQDSYLDQFQQEQLLELYECPNCEHLSATRLV